MLALHHERLSGSGCTPASLRAGNPLVDKTWLIILRPTFRDHIGIQLSDIILAGDIAFRHLPPIIIIIIIVIVIT